MKPIKKVLGCLRKADNDYHLIEDGDKIAVGLSGGKDSSLLLYCLKLYQQFSKKNYEVIGLHCDLNFGPIDFTPLKDYFKALDIPVYENPTQIYDILKLYPTNTGKLECSLCAKLRKGAIINAAKELGCNKIAFGHHNDDAVETLFMNMIHGGRIATFKPNTPLERSGVQLIRPLIYAYENDIVHAVEQLEIPVISSGCPNDGNTERQDIKDLLQQLYHDYRCKDNFSLMLRNFEKVELFEPDHSWMDEKENTQKNKE